MIGTAVPNSFGIKLQPTCGYDLLNNFVFGLVPLFFFNLKKFFYN